MTPPTTELRLDPNCPFALENAHELRVHRKVPQRGPKKGVPRVTDPQKVLARQEAQQRAQAKRKARAEMLAAQYPESMRAELVKEFVANGTDQNGLTRAQRAEIRKEKEAWRAEKKLIASDPKQHLRHLEEEVSLLRARHQAYRQEFLTAKGLLVHDSDAEEQEQVYALKKKALLVLRVLNRYIAKLKKVKEELAKQQASIP